MSSAVCQKCTGPYNDPRILSCLHSFCTECLEQEPSRDTIACPSCQQITSLPKGGVTSLPRNLRLSNNQENTLNRIISTPSPSCNSCDNESAVAYCTECAHLLCQGCWDAHQTVKVTRTHSSFTLEEARKMSREEVMKLLPSSTLICQDHPRQELDFYCQQCAIPVCVKCTVINHRDHSVTEVNQQVGNTKADIHQTLEDIGVSQEWLKKVLTNGEERKGEIKLQKEEVNSTIQEAIANLCQLLRQREEALLAESEKIATAKEDRLSHQLEGIQHLLEAMTICQSIATTAIGEYSDVELLSVAHTVQIRASQLQEQFSQTPLELCESPTLSVTVNKDALAKRITCLGSVDDRIYPCPDHTVVNVPLHIPVGKESKIKVMAKNASGKALSTGGAVLSGQLTSTAVAGGGKSVQAKVTDCGDGTYVISLTPRVFGQHQLSVSIDQEPINGSPHNVYISRDYTAIKEPVLTVADETDPYFMAFSDDGDMFVTSYSDHCVYVYDSNTQFKKTIGSYGTGKLQFNCPSGIAINGNTVYVAEYRGNRIQKFTLNGKYLGTFGLGGSATGQLMRPWGICVDCNGLVYIANSENNRVDVFNRDGTHSRAMEYQNAQYVAVDRFGNLHVTGFKRQSVTVFAPNGKYRYPKQSNLKGPCGIAFDPAGYSLVATGNNGEESLVIFDPCNDYSSHYKVKLGSSPSGLAVAPDGSIWIADIEKKRVLKY